MDPFCKQIELARFPAFVSPPNDVSIPDPFRFGTQADGTMFPERAGEDPLGNVFIPGNGARITAGTREVRYGPFGDPPQRIIDVVNAFTEKGGQYYAAPILTEDSKKPVTPFKIHFTQNDVLIPICHEGVNRSQIMFLALQAVSKQAGVKPCISVPHGAESGFDPYQAYENLDAVSAYGYIHGHILPRGSEGEWLHDNFYRAFGVEKQSRIGEAEHAESGGAGLNPLFENAIHLQEIGGNRQAQRRRMDALLYNARNLLAHRKSPAGKVIIFAFARAAAIIMRRMLEQDQVLEGICIVALPWGDSIASAGGMDEIRSERVAGRVVDRDQLSVQHHKDVFAMYCSVISAVQSKYRQIIHTAVDAADAFGLAELSRYLGEHAQEEPGAVAPFEDLDCYFYYSKPVKDLYTFIYQEFIRAITEAPTRAEADRLRIGIACFKHVLCQYAHTQPRVRVVLNRRLPGFQHADFFVLPYTTVNDVFEFVKFKLQSSHVALTINAKQFLAGQRMDMAEDLFAHRITGTLLKFSQNPKVRKLIQILEDFEGACYVFMDDERQYAIMQPYIEPVHQLRSNLERAATLEELKLALGQRVSAVAPARLRHPLVADAFEKSVNAVYRLDNDEMIAAVLNAVNYAFSAQNGAARTGGRVLRRNSRIQQK
jgi:hypothetical protein